MVALQRFSFCCGFWGVLDFFFGGVPARHVGVISHHVYFPSGSIRTPSDGLPQDPKHLSLKMRRSR